MTLIFGTKNPHDFNRTYRNFTIIWIRKVEVSVRGWHNGVEYFMGLVDVLREVEYVQVLGGFMDSYIDIVDTSCRIRNP